MIQLIPRSFLKIENQTMTFNRSWSQCTIVMRIVLDKVHGSKSIQALIFQMRAMNQYHTVSKAKYIKWRQVFEITSNRNLTTMVNTKWKRLDPKKHRAKSNSNKNHTNIKITPTAQVLWNVKFLRNLRIMPTKSRRCFKRHRWVISNKIKTIKIIWNSYRTNKIVINSKPMTTFMITKTCLSPQIYLIW